jgi:Spy/CpxP family protein refolding chaperone
MKKILLVVFASIVGFSVYAQVQRPKTTKQTKDSTVIAQESAVADMPSRKEMFKQLNLTRQQKIKLKTLKQDGKTKKDAINNEATLTEADKQIKLKELKKQQLTATMSVLNEEQKTKLKQLLKEKKEDEGVMMDEN